MPAWVSAACEDYLRRLPRELKGRIVEIPPGLRGRSGDARKAMQEEGRRMLRAIPDSARVIALEVDGKSWSSEMVAEQLAKWQQDGRDVALLIGGPDGLDATCRQRAGQNWSLSALTFPHALARVILAEQLYRATTILKGHPYHRGGS